MSKKRPRLAGFLEKTWTMVNEPSTDSFIHWTDSGLTFFVPDRNAMEKNVLPNYFKHNKFSSFIRQLNMYGFRKIGDPHHWEFAHDHFVRGNKEGMHNIKRKTNTASSASRSKKKGGDADVRRELDDMADEIETLKGDRDALNSEVFTLANQITILKQQMQQMANLVGHQHQLLALHSQQIASGAGGADASSDGGGGGGGSGGGGSGGGGGGDGGGVHAVATAASVPDSEEADLVSNGIVPLPASNTGMTLTQVAVPSATAAGAGGGDLHSHPPPDIKAPEPKRKKVSHLSVQVPENKITFSGSLPSLGLTPKSPSQNTAGPLSPGIRNLLTAVDQTRSAEAAAAASNGTTTTVGGSGLTPQSARPFPMN